MLKKSGIQQPIVIEDLDRFKSYSKKPANVFDKRVGIQNSADIRALIGLLRNGSSAGDITKAYAESVETKEGAHRSRADYLDKLSNKIKKKKRTMSMSAAEKRYAKTLGEFQERVFNNSPNQNSKISVSTRKTPKSVTFLKKDYPNRQKEELSTNNPEPVPPPSSLRAIDSDPHLRDANHDHEQPDSHTVEHVDTEPTS
jgi:hypothetical protein